MIAGPFRELLLKERELLGRLFTPAFPGREELSEQLESAKVKVIDEDGSLEFLISSSTKAKNVKYVVPTEGEYEDSDGVIVHILLHLLGDKAQELEFFREDGTPVRQWPDPQNVRVFAPT